MGKKFSDLIDVKSIVTLVLTGVFAYLSVIGKMTGEQFMTVFVMIMTYFFTKKDSPDNVTSETTTVASSGMVEGREGE